VPVTLAVRARLLVRADRARAVQRARSVMVPPVRQGLAARCPVARAQQLGRRLAAAEPVRLVVLPHAVVAGRAAA
jgi:hypothetical protein